MESVWSVEPGVLWVKPPGKPRCGNWLLTPLSAHSNTNRPLANVFPFDFGFTNFENRLLVRYVITASLAIRIGIQTVPGLILMIHEHTFAFSAYYLFSDSFLCQ